MFNPVAKQAESGFTLIELLTSIFIFALVISSVYGAYRATFTTVNGTESRVALASAARVILERITDDLESLYIGEDGYIQGEKGDIGGHRADGLSCTSSAHLVFSRSELMAGVTVLKYTTEEEESGLLTLYRSDVPVLPGVTSGDDDEKGVLLGKGLQAFQLTYVSADGNESEEWDSEPEGSGSGGSGEKKINLPAIVRVEIRFADSPESEDSTVFRTAVAMPVQLVEDSPE